MKRSDCFPMRVFVNAALLSMVAIAGWSQHPSLIWLSTLSGEHSEAFGVVDAQSILEC